MSEIIFITGRFRSGTSMLWNLFNQLPDYCAYYEPLHPNLISHIKHVKPKQDHLGIDDYWHNYTKLENLTDYYSPSFGQSRLYMEKHEKWRELEKYIRFLIDNTGNQIPVIKFNRADLRINWLKNTFPHATIININRDVFPLWLSSRKHLQSEKNKHNESHPDAYDLLQWSVDLAPRFPMLQKQSNRSSYYRHYFIWKLSRLLARKNTDVHLNLENDFIKSNEGIKILSNKFNWDSTQIDSLKKFIQQPDSSKNEIAINEQFLKIEKEIDTTFKQLGLNQLLPSSPLSEIKIEYKNNWDKYSYNPDIITQELLSAMQFQKDELTALVN